MALTPPNVDDLEEFSNEEYPTDIHDYLETLLQGATDALWVFTGMDEYPEDERLNRITRLAILDLTLWLYSQAEHRTEINSPFSSERIGSYSYSKMQAASKDGSSGIYWLDLLFAALKAPGSDGGSSWVSSERVFNPEGYDYATQEFVDRYTRKTVLHDPSEGFFF